MRTDLVELTSAMVAIDSVNPALVPGGAGEGEIARFVADWARAAGLEATILEATAGRPSVIVRVRGSGGERAPDSGGGRTLLLCGHLDTVGVEGMAAPHAPRVDGDRLHGRGAFDMKGGLAAALIACREAAALGLAGDVVVAAVADEEHASLGVQEALEGTWADGAIVTEPTQMELVVAHKGFLWGEIEVSGRAAHGSRPDLGLDAIVKTGPILTALGRLDERLTERGHPLVGRGSLHASLIAGGAELSSYPASCVLGLERRTLPGETAAAVQAELEALLDGCRAADADLAATQRTLLVRAPFEVAPSAPIVAAVGAAAAEVCGAEPPLSGAAYWTDAAFIAAAGIPTVLFGPRGEGAHAVEEWVSIADLEAVARVLVATARSWCA
jgi:acetylornithine deacetylase